MSRMVLDISITRVWSNPSPHTFTIGPIAQLLAEEVGDSSQWVDPFAGFHSLAPPQQQNDLNPDTPAVNHFDALQWLRGLDAERYDGVFFDPPYSLRQATEVYKAYGAGQQQVTNMGYWARCRDEAARVVKPGGKAICCGWNTGGLGNQRLFGLDRVLLVPHGGARNDTLVTVEHKKGGKLF